MAKFAQLVKQVSFRWKRWRQKEIEKSPYQEGLATAIRRAELTVCHPSASMGNARDLLNGETSRPLWTQVGNNVVIHNAQVSTSAVAYEIK